MLNLSNAPLKKRKNYIKNICQKKLVWTIQALTQALEVLKHGNISHCGLARNPRTCAIIIPAWGSNCGYSGLSRNQNNRDSSGAYVLRSEGEYKHAWNAAWCAKIMGIFCLRLFLRVWSAKTRIPPIGAPLLTTPLHGVVQKLWDLFSISVGLAHFSGSNAPKGVDHIESQGAKVIPHN